MIEPANLIDGRWKALPAEALRSHMPSHPDRTVWCGSPRLSDVDEAVASARRSALQWSRSSVEARAAALEAYRSMLERRIPDLAALICDEAGKAMWEAEAEAKLLATKVETTLVQAPMHEGSGRARITDFEIPLGATRTGRCSFRAHGVMAVLGPFNFPAHLPNGHIVPALLAGNTIVFKPSDKTPAVGQLLASILHEALMSAGAPAGVVNLVHGASDVASRLVAHEDIDGVLFTGSWPVGRRILEANIDRPGRIIALELGGNNPAIVMPDADLRLAAIECARASFATTGQRCTCTRRIIVHEAIAERFISMLERISHGLVIGDPRGVGDSAPFMGPIIREDARTAALASQRAWASAGARVVLESRPLDVASRGHYVTPGILEVPRFERSEGGCGGDIEVFGPIVRVVRVRDLDHAIEQANATRYGLAASIFTAHNQTIERFLNEVRAGCLNINTGTAGASGKLPFGGVGLSGNHRPAGSFALDYCAYPVASMIERGVSVALSPGMVFDERWLG